MLVRNGFLLSRGGLIGFCLWVVWLATSVPVWGQYNANQQRRDASAPLPEIEAELNDLAQTFQQNKMTTRAKDSINRHFSTRLQTVLKRPDSYNYPFAKLITLSRIFPEDQSFRIFTWAFYVFDSIRQPVETRYYGCIQRKLKLPNGQPYLQLKMLADVVEPNDKGEQTSFEFFSPEKWLGALYYAPRHSEFGVLTYKGTVKMADGLTGKVEKRKVNYYILLGLNQHNIEKNYKFIDVITFDPKDTNTISFGAPIFYFSGNIARKRVVFEYTDNSPFTLNLGYILTENFSRKRKELVIVFDHLDQMGKSPQQHRQAAGADGTYDAFYFYKRKLGGNQRGLFFFLRNVTVYAAGLEQFRPKELKRQKRNNRKRIRRLQVPFR